MLIAQIPHTSKHQTYESLLSSGTRIVIELRFNVNSQSEELSKGHLSISSNTPKNNRSFTLKKGLGTDKSQYGRSTMSRTTEIKSNQVYLRFVNKKTSDLFHVYDFTQCLIKRVYLDF